MPLTKKLSHHLTLMRFDKPIGWLLLLWPTLWALWVATDGQPTAKLVWIFSLGVIVMRSAGCVINDYADRNIDPLVERTKSRPLAAGRVSVSQTLGLFVLLACIAMLLLVQLPMRVWPWSIPAIIITIAYPYMKRFIQAPQLVLGLAFSFGIPMVFVTVDRSFDLIFWLLMLVNFCWVLVFDTAYAMSDREDDLKIGVNSTAILFGSYDKAIVALLQTSVIIFWLWLSYLLELDGHFYIALLLATSLFGYQQYLINNRERHACFQAFLNNGWVGAVIWFGLLTAF